jgi:hypothetical protein
MNGGLVEIATRFREAEAPGGAHEQLSAEMRLEGRQLFADRWLVQTPSSRPTVEKLPLSTTRTKS